MRGLAYSATEEGEFQVQDYSRDSMVSRHWKAEIIFQGEHIYIYSQDHPFILINFLK